MKKLSIILIFFLTVLNSHFTLAQNEGRLEDLYLEGKWEATCATEIIDRVSIQHCELCFFVLNPNDKSQAEVKSLEMDFQKDSLILNQNGLRKSVPYQRDTNNHSFTFTLNEKQYNFRMFLYNNQRIIEDSDGMLIMLDKITN